MLYTADYHNPIAVAELEAFLKTDHDFKYATVVHCDTPSGVCNDVEEISKLLDKYGIMTVADTVAALFGEPLDLSNSKIDTTSKNAFFVGYHLEKHFEKLQTRHA